MKSEIFFRKKIVKFNYVSLIYEDRRHRDILSLQNVINLAPISRIIYMKLTRYVP